MWIVVQLELSEAMMQMLTPWNVSTHHSSLPQPEDESLETVQTAPLSQPYFLHGYSAWDLRSDSNPLPMHRFSGMKWPDALTPFPHMLNCCGKLVTPALSADTNPPILVIAVGSAPPWGRICGPRIQCSKYSLQSKWCLLAEDI